MPHIRETRQTAPTLEQKVDVLILGAGAAGIGAGTLLQNEGIDFLILEGADYAGGRIRSKYAINTDPNLQEKVLVSAGAQWLHGTANPLYEYAKNNGLTVIDQSQTRNGLFKRDDGLVIDETLTEAIEKIVGDTLKEASNFYEKDITPYPASLDKFLTERFETKILSMPSDQQIQARQLLDWHRKSLSVDNAADDFKKISAKHWGRFENIGGAWAHISLKNGFAEVLQLMANDLGSNKIVFNKVVDKVHWAAESTPNNVVVKTTDGSIYTANHVITTFSLGVLKHDASSIFVPALPAKHTAAINCLGYGAMTKIFLQFETPWWGESKGFQFIFSDIGIPDNETNFLRYMSGFDFVYTGPPNTLVGWVANRGVDLVEQLTDKEIIDAVVKQIEKFLGNSIQYPKRYFVSRWLNNPLTRGAYSYACVDCDKDDITPNDLAAKITPADQYAYISSATSGTGSPLLQFAGEGSSQVYYSTAHGAYLSGENAAKNIIAYKNSQ